MSGALFLAALAILPVFGWIGTAPRAVRELPLAGRIAVAACCGAVLLCLLMGIETFAGARWTIAGLAIPLAIAAVPALRFSRDESRAVSPLARRDVALLCVAAAALVLALYAAATARATASDLLFFWGTKAQQFARERGFDAAFLRTHGLHSDYPPMAPFLFAWGALWAGRFPWGAALLTFPLFLGFTALAFWGFGRRALGNRRAAEWTAFLVALLAGLGVGARIAGNADPILLFFQAVALAALTFLPERGDLVATMALVGAVLTKVEGAAFAGLAILFFVTTRPRAGRLRALGALAVPPLAALGIWMFATNALGLSDSYQPGGGYGSFTTAHLATVLSTFAEQASFGAAYLPWILIGALGVAIAPRRPAWPALGIAVGFILFILFSYLHGDADPAPWIKWSADRLLLTPLLCLVFALAAADAGRGPRESST